MSHVTDWKISWPHNRTRKKTFFRSRPNIWQQGPAFYDVYASSRNSSNACLTMHTSYPSLNSVVHVMRSIRCLCVCVSILRCVLWVFTFNFLSLIHIADATKPSNFVGSSAWAESATVSNSVANWVNIYVRGGGGKREVLLFYYISRETYRTRLRNVYWSRASVCLCVCVSVCLSLGAFPNYCTDPDVTWRKSRGCPLVVHYWADLQPMHGFRYYDNRAPSAKSEPVLLLALRLVVLLFRLFDTRACLLYTSPSPRD